MADGYNSTAAKLESLQDFAASMQAQFQEVNAAIDAAWILSCAFLVFGMQIGFTLLEAGCVKSNLRSMLMKNVMGTGLCTFSWWFIGNAFMRGSINCSFAGIDVPFRLVGSHIGWFWDLSFVCAASTVVSGAMAERVKFVGYCVFVLWMSGFVYPFVAHWEWTHSGFLSFTNPTAALPMLDFAGCGAVHLLGGMASLVGAWMVGPRPGAFIDQMPVYTKKEHMVQDRLAATLSLYSVMGVMILWICWYGFNCGSAGGIVGKVDEVGLVAVNTTVAATVGALVASVVSYTQYRLFKVDVVLMGILSGLVSITGSSPWVHTYMVVPIAIIGFLIYHSLVLLLVKLGIDDPVAAFPIHAGCGFWGLLAAGLFQDSKLSGVQAWGTQLRNQFAGAVIIAAWSLTMSLVGLYALHWLLHGLRHVDAEAEFRRDTGVQNAHGPRGAVTLLFTDIQSSTVLWETDEECMEEALAMHDNVFRSTLQSHNGFEVKTEGDAFMCAFGSTVDCAKFCVAVQHRLMEVKWPKSLYCNVPARIEDDGAGHIIWKGLRVRMGFHTGEPSAQENPLTQRTDYFGKDVNYAARISGVGSGGQIVLSSASVRELLPFAQDNSSLLEEEPFGLCTGEQVPLPALSCYLEYVGQRPLKGISGPESEGEHVYQLRPFGLETRSFVPVATEAPPVVAGSVHYAGRWSSHPSPKSMQSILSELSGSYPSRARRFSVLAKAAVSPIRTNPLMPHVAWNIEEARMDSGTPPLTSIPPLLPG